MWQPETIVANNGTTTAAHLVVPRSNYSHQFSSPLILNVYVYVVVAVIFPQIRIGGLVNKNPEAILRTDISLKQRLSLSLYPNAETIPGAFVLDGASTPTLGKSNPNTPVVVTSVLLQFRPGLVNNRDTCRLVSRAIILARAPTRFARIMNTIRRILGNDIRFQRRLRLVRDTDPVPVPGALIPPGGSFGKIKETYTPLIVRARICLKYRFRSLTAANSIIKIVRASILPRDTLCIPRKANAIDAVA